MPINLFVLNAYPDRIAVSMTASTIEALTPESTFFLDFSRPIIVHRWFGVRNNWIGIAGVVTVPVIHQGEENGGYVVTVGRSDPYFNDLRKLWKARYPSKVQPPTHKATGLQIVADFAIHFPDFSF